MKDETMRKVNTTHRSRKDIASSFTLQKLIPTVGIRKEEMKNTLRIKQ